MSCLTQRPGHDELILAWAQALAFKLGAQQWEFEAARDAFGDTMRKFAPGGGAGHFLARAIARRSEQVCNCSNDAHIQLAKKCNEHAAVHVAAACHSALILMHIIMCKGRDAAALARPLQTCLLLQNCFNASVPFAGVLLLAL